MEKRNSKIKSFFIILQSLNTIFIANPREIFLFIVNYKQLLDEELS